MYKKNQQKEKIRHRSLPGYSMYEFVTTPTRLTLLLKTQAEFLASFAPPPKTHPPHAESKAKAIETRSTSLDGFAPATLGGEGEAWRDMSLLLLFGRSSSRVSNNVGADVCACLFSVFQAGPTPPPPLPPDLRPLLRRRPLPVLLLLLLLPLLPPVVALLHISLAGVSRVAGGSRSQSS